MSPIIPELLRTSIIDSTDRTIFERGQLYYELGKVKSIVFSDEDGSVVVTGDIRGSHLYKTRIIIDAADPLSDIGSEMIDHTCSCPYDDGAVCKHIVALGLAAVDAIRKKQHTETHTAEKISPPVELFEKKYYIVLRTAQGILYDIRLELYTQHTYQSSWWGYQRPRAKDILREHNITPEQKELLDTVAQYESYTYADKGKKHPDLARFFDLVEQVGMSMRHSDDYNSRTQKIEIRAPEKFATTLYREEKSSQTQYDREEYPYQRIILKLSGTFSREVYAAAATEQGSLIIIKKGRLEVHTIPTELAKIIGRAIAIDQYNEYGRYIDPPQRLTTKQAALLDHEYVDIENIVAACKKYTNADIQIAEHYTIQHHTPQAVMIVDYSREEKKLSILPSVDYGGVILPIFDTVTYSYSQTKKGFVRRMERAFGTTHVVRISENTIHIAPVTWKKELILCQLGLKKSATLGIKRNGRIFARGDTQIARCVEKYIPEIKKWAESSHTEIRYVHDMLEISTADFRADFDIDFDAHTDWLAFDLEMYCGAERVSLADIEACMNSGNNFLKTKEGNILRISNPEAMKRIMDMLVHFRKTAEGKYEGRTYHAPELNAISTGSKHYTARVSSSFQTFITQAKKGKMVSTVRIPTHFSAVLRDYQIEGIYWLHFLHHYRFAGVLADDMGLGKTLQALAILSIHAQKDRPSLIVVPKTLIHNWEAEVHRFAPHLKLQIIEGTQLERAAAIKHIKKYDLVVTSYPALQKDIEVYEKQKIIWNYCVIDEAQYIKNPRTKNTHTVRRVQSDYRLALTGTPLENSVEEVWSMFDFLMPGFLGHHAHFQKHIGHPIMKRSDAQALERLKTKVQCFMLRRTKEEVLKELPPKVEQIVECDMSDEQNILYQDVLKRVKKDITEQVQAKGFAASQIHILAGLTRLRQICNHPLLVLPQKKRGIYPSAKLDVCMNIVEQIQKENRKILVFSQFTKMLDILGEELEKRKIEYSYLSGMTTDRKGTVEGFIDDPAKTVFLISTKTGGVGLNLTVADAVIIFDPWWNPQVERQAIDRTHRIGQKKTVQVYCLRTVGTIEEKIALLQDRKRNLFNALVGDSKDLFKKLTWDDVKSLLSL
jgi:SNF2-related domain/Helicase conserved C-terminal domain/SWIM zinc finger